MAEIKKAGSPLFYEMLKEMEEIHEKKSHDYASNDNPFGNYEFAGQVSSMFSHSPRDAGFAGRIAEKIFRLAVLERDNKTPKNESIEDTERDIATIVVLWMANRRERRGNPKSNMAIYYKGIPIHSCDKIPKDQPIMLSYERRFSYCPYCFEALKYSE